MSGVGSLVILGVAGCFAGYPGVWADTTINNSNKYAYGANIGWINFQGDTNNGAAIGQCFCTGYVYSANCGWISLGNGPTNEFQYSNAATNDYGVNHDGAGNLRGFAYGANIGWINVESNGNPRVDLSSGRFSGFAWGANVGWISLSNAVAFVQTDVLDPGPDTDHDGVPDPWELKTAGFLTELLGGTNDFDEDGISDSEEYASDTDPTDNVDFLRITGGALSGGGATSMVAWASEPTRLYQLERTPRASNQASWVDSGLGVVPPDAGFETIRPVSNDSDTTRVFRVRAVVPLAP